jgi:hypothetical protein
MARNKELSSKTGENQILENTKYNFMNHYFTRYIGRKHISCTSRTLGRVAGKRRGEECAYLKARKKE